MQRLIILVGLLSLAAYGYSNYSASGSSVEILDGAIVRDTGQFEAQFERQGTLSENYMIFGGNLDRKLTNSFSDVSLAALDMGNASRINSRYPDFHRCKSPGAPMAQRLTRTLNLVAENDEALDVLEDSLVVHMDNIQSDGDRTCISLQGSDISLASVKLKENGADISRDVVPTMHKMNFFLIERAQLVDCRSLL